MTTTRQCPPWCDDHYTAPDGGQYCARSSLHEVDGVGQLSGAKMTALTWIEQHAPLDGTWPHVVGILRVEHDDPRPADADQREDIELTRTEMIRLAEYLLRVAGQIQATESRFGPTEVADIVRTQAGSAGHVRGDATSGNARRRWVRRVTRRRRAERAA